jgi:cysteinyl-tRNA synthetase
MIKLYSTLDRKLVEVQPIKDKQLSIYSCGPTVYYRMQVGNIRAYINWDIMHRALLYLGFKVKRVVNMTDVGHMTSCDDYGSDFGEDRMDRQSKREGLEPIDIANKYIDTVLDDFRKLNILAPDGELIPEGLTYEEIAKHGFARATEYVDEMIKIIEQIEANGYTYETNQALYFDVSKVPDYTIFTGQLLEDKETGAREEVEVDPEKKNPADFVLWMKRYGKYKDHIMNWESPWGNGFPGWHIECTAMGTAILGEKFDIHTGGVDHIPVHHANERAQNIGAFGHPVVKYWVHNEWVVNSDDSKLSKSKGNAIDLPTVLELGFDAMDLRYLLLSINYRTRIQFSLKSLEGARNARISLLKKIKELGNKRGNVIEEYKKRFEEELSNNLNMSGVLALINELLKSDYPQNDILSTILDFDRVLGLDIEKEVSNLNEIPADSDVKKLLDERENAKADKNYEEADRLREEIVKFGYKVLDTPDGQKLERI